MYNVAALFLNHTPATASHHYDLNPDVIMQVSLSGTGVLPHAEPCQAQHAVCDEYHKFVLNHRHKKEVCEDGGRGGGEASYDNDHGDSADIDIDDDSWASVRRQLGIEAFRPLQQEALDIIKQVSTVSHHERRMATAGVVTPTSSGKDLLPLALSKLKNGVCLMFVPFK